MVGSPGFHTGHDAFVVSKLIGAGIVGFRYRLSMRYDEPGEYAFTCQIGMYRGHVVVS